MPISLVVNNIPFEYPSPGDSPGWGQPATDWASEVTLVLTELFGPNDLAETTFNIANNISAFTNVAGLLINTGAVRSADISYSVYRTSTSNPSGFSESGIINVTYDNLAASGSKWSLIQYGINGSSGVIFNITDGGQVQYKSSDLGATGYSGVMHYRVKTLGQ